MSTYLSYRRRYSEPVKPEPRFQWRLRVHSLMMDDDSDQTPPLTERPSQRYTSRRESYGYNTDHSQENRDADSNDLVDSAEIHRTRRERFARTKSEGHLKLRVRFSRFSNTTHSFDEDDDSSLNLQSDSERTRFDSEPEGRRFRSSQESGIGSFGEHHTDEEEDQHEGPRTNADAKKIRNKCAYANDDNEDDGFVSDEKTGASVSGEAVASAGATASFEDFAEDQNRYGQERDVSRGAIPKRHLNLEVSRPEGSSQSNDKTDPEVSGARQNEISFETAHEEVSSKQNTLNTENKIDPCRSSGNEDGWKSSYADVKAKNKYAKYNTNEEENKQENNSEIDDLESMIERIIAEEEAILTRKSSNPTSIKSSVDSLNNDDLKTPSNSMNKLKDNAENDKDVDENGISISRNNNQDNQRSSSLPSYQQDENNSLTNTTMSFSSSCPSSQKTLAKENKDKEESEIEEDGWAYLPVILLEDVFTLLSPKERHQASMVCRQWYDLFYSPRVWETFILLERTLTKKRFNLYKGYQRELCPGKTQLCFRRVGSYFKRIVVTPITDYFNLYEFLRILAAFLQYQEEHGLAAMPLLHTFDFTFACASRGDGEVIVHGTGGQILEMIKQLLMRISNLKHLKLNQLLVDETDVPGLFDAMANCFSECLSSLEMLNVTKIPFGLTDLARFRNLVKLTVSPQHLNEEVLILLAGLNLLQLHLVQDAYTCDCEPVSYEAWKLVREMAPWLRVYLEVCGHTRAHLLVQPRAPVYGVFLRTPYSKLTSDLVMSLVEYYSKTLHYFVQENLPRVHGPRGIDARCDSSLLFLVRRCPALHTLVIRERISTSTLILLANEGKNLRTLLVRRHALIKRCDWPQPGMWTKEFYARLRKCALDYDKCIDEVCKLLMRRWRPMTDKQFMRLKIVPRLDSFRFR
ncbi:unnamed protein product [Candidula unifasciata]|uniref:F-box domain-containing protein n=1 Tax=Candidula unifasciata TaxID=100452 RepID=A0A8S3ZLL6_9EUPU|nr:unnamed protein product [Candidula unifasciata]